VERLEKYINGATAVIGAVVGYLFGGWTLLLQVVIALTVADYITGLAAGYVEGTLSSKTGFRGGVKKALIFVIIAVAHMVDRLIGEGNTVMTAACFFYISNELLSILENCTRAGLPTPEILKKALLILKDKGGNGNDAQ
jgi:toxin secretion/phage lysis holin